MDMAIFNKMLAMVDNEDKILGFVYNNGYRTMFTKEPFRKAKHVDVVNECIVTTDRDPNGIPFKIIRHIEFVEAILSVDNVEDIKRINARYIGG